MVLSPRNDFIWHMFYDFLPFILEVLCPRHIPLLFVLTLRSSGSVLQTVFQRRQGAAMRPWEAPGSPRAQHSLRPWPSHAAPCSPSQRPVPSHQDLSVGGPGAGTASPHRASSVWSALPLPPNIRFNAISSKEPFQLPCGLLDVLRVAFTSSIAWQLKSYWITCLWAPGSYRQLCSLMTFQCLALSRCSSICRTNKWTFKVHNKSVYIAALSFIFSSCYPNLYSINSEKSYFSFWSMLESKQPKKINK